MEEDGPVKGLEDSVPGGSGKNKAGQAGRSQILRGLNGRTCVWRDLFAVVQRTNWGGRSGSSKVC